MNRLPSPKPVSQTSSTDCEPPHHTRNFGLLASYMVAMRTGWIFKTETIIMPAVVDAIGGSSWLRGFLPMLNRFGQSVPPLLASGYIRSAPLKKRMLVVTTSLMSVCFLGLAGIWAWTDNHSEPWLTIAFLVLYAIFFAATGVNMLLMNTLKGKLTKVRRRGLLDLVSCVFGGALAIACAWFLMTRWLGASVASTASKVGLTVSTVDAQLAGAAGKLAAEPNFTMIFFFTGLMFAVAGVIGCFYAEVPDDIQPERRSIAQIFRAAFTTFCEDRNFRRLAIVGMMFGMSVTLFPHYQSLARSRLSLDTSVLVSWVIAQNFGTAVFSIPTGWAADRLGNRRVLNTLMLSLCLVPMLALFLSRSDDVGSGWFNAVFLLLGMAPVTVRTLNNYTLEICAPADRPRYLSSLGLCVAAPPMLLSVLMGWLVDLISFEFVFWIGTACLFVGWLLTFRLIEPRHSQELSV